MMTISQGRSGEMKRSQFMDTCARIWQSIGEKFRTRPITVLGVLIGAIIFASSLTYVLVRQGDADHRLDEVASAFCDGRNPDPEKCRKLLDALLKNPTPAQARRLREIVETP